MIVTEGGRVGGYGLYLLKGKPVFTYNLLQLLLPRWAGEQPLDAGQAHDRVRLQVRRPRRRQGRHRRTEGGRPGGRHADDLRSTIPFLIPADETFDVGVDTRTGVNDQDYKVPFRFNGTIEKLTFKLGPTQLTALA